MNCTIYTLHSKTSQVCIRITAQDDTHAHTLAVERYNVETNHFDLIISRSYDSVLERDEVLSRQRGIAKALMTLVCADFTYRVNHHETNIPGVLL